jgi:hypothetical protein
LTAVYGKKNDACSGLGVKDPPISIALGFILLVGWWTTDLSLFPPLDRAQTTNTVLKLGTASHALQT